MSLSEAISLRGTLNIAGRNITVVRKFPAGRSHDVFLGSVNGEARVVLKISGPDSDRLAEENRNLTALTSAGYPCPKPLGFQRIRDSGDRGFACLLLEFVPGAAPASTSSFFKLGLRIAQLHQMSGLRHGLRVREVSRLSGKSPEILQALSPQERCLAQKASADTRADPGGLVFSHGDASAENFIDGESGGMLIDFEACCQQPAAADIGRCLLTLGGEVAACASPEAAAAFLRGYDSAAPLPPRSLIDAWIIAESLRIAQWRYENRVYPRTPSWKDALAATRVLLHRMSQKEAAKC